MIIIQEKIHTILAGNTILPEKVRDNVQSWQSDDDTPWAEKFPMITHGELSSEPLNNSLGVWRSYYQVSVWTRTKLEGREIGGKILEILNRYGDRDIEACTVQSVSNSYDIDTETQGIHFRFAIVWRE